MTPKTEPRTPTTTKAAKGGIVAEPKPGRRRAPVDPMAAERAAADADDYSAVIAAARRQQPRTRAERPDAAPMVAYALRLPAGVLDDLAGLAQERGEQLGPMLRGWLLERLAVERGVAADVDERIEELVADVSAAVRSKLVGIQALGRGQRPKS